MFKGLIIFSFCMTQIGFSAPQGCGKTTLVFALDYLFQMIGRYAFSFEAILIEFIFYFDDYINFQEVCNNIYR